MASCDVGLPDSGPDEGHPCADLCDIEVQCGFRSLSECEAQSCDGDTRIPTDSDDCIAAATDCAEVALCSCDDACLRVDDCTGSDDGACDADCETLVEQDPENTYRENRCLVETEACEDIATCGGVAG